LSHNHDILSTLRNRGYRITPQREMIIETITRNPAHFTADEIYSAVQKKTQTMNVATVYRTLDVLVEEGLVSRSDFGQGHVVYATEDHGPHIHLICRQCGEVMDAEASLALPLKEKLKEQYQFDLSLHHLAAFGLCPKCQKEDKES